MAKITNLSEIREQRDKKRAKKGFLFIVVILLVTVVFTLLFSNRSKYSVNSFFELFQSGSGYPIEAPGGKSKGMYELSGLLTVVNDTDLMMYNGSGAKTFSAKHHMADPQLQIRDDMLLIFDQGSKSYALYQKNQPLVDSQTDYIIYTGDVSSRGTFALATRSADYLSKITVYDKSNKELYSWNYSDKVVSSMAISPSGNKLAVCGIFTEDGTIKSQLLIYNNGELVDSRIFDDAVICSLIFVGESEIRGITDKTAFLISDKGKLMGEFDYKSKPLAAFCNTVKSTVILLGDYKQDGGYELISLNSSMNKQCSTSIKGNIHTIKNDANNAYILAGKNYYQIDLFDGNHLVEEESEYIYDLQPIDRNVYAITNEEIVRMIQVKSEDRDNQTSIIPEPNKDNQDDFWEEDNQNLDEEISDENSEEILDEVLPEEIPEILNPEEPGL